MFVNIAKLSRIIMLIEGLSIPYIVYNKEPAQLRSLNDNADLYVFVLQSVEASTKSDATTPKVSTHIFILSNLCC